MTYAPGLQLILFFFSLGLFVPMLVLLMLKATRSWGLVLKLEDGFVFLVLLADSFLIMVPRVAFTSTWAHDGALDYFSRIPAGVHLVILTLISLWCFRGFAKIRATRCQRFSLRSVREALDNLPSGLCLAHDNGVPVFTNRQMYKLASLITGRFLSNLLVFWAQLIDKDSRGDVIYRQYEGQDFFFLPDGQVWRFLRASIEIEGETFLQLVAMDVSQLWQIAQELRQENRELDAQHQRLRSLLDDLVAMSQQEEILASKIRLHERLGRAILSSKQCLQGVCAPEHCKKLIYLWRDLTAQLQANVEAPEASDVLDELIQVASALGCTIRFEGDFPHDNHILITAVREALTNMVRHAQGNELTVKTKEEADQTVVCISDNGTVAVDHVVEGSGLSGLRQSVELAGGQMDIICDPGVALHLRLPKLQPAMKGVQK